MSQRNLPPSKTAKHSSIRRSLELDKFPSLHSWRNPQSVTYCQSLYPVAGTLPSQRRRILEACPCLQNLVLRYSGPLAGLSRQVSLPLLKQLHYGYSCVGDDVGLFSGLHAPNLITLSLEARSLSTAYSPTQDDGEDDIDRLLKYCATHFLFPKLQKLSLYNVNAAVNTFALLMDATPTLLHLLLHRTPNALPALLPIQKSLAGAGVPCPALESIYIFPSSHKDSLIVTLKERSKSCPRFAEWLCEEMLEGGITVFFGCSRVV
ncbi:hypothetical protein EV702DRAFT_1202255 [Suillus placidus]|uniref:Uncharacterized protein n=1 Tax=Suillus placidus TaxID=48579 RepID=A0A9P6ZKY9_9AGAM|nr:hypothetical protein EV702DRAFT_1202255 [Suillus placidus]